jgi:hypothetical protein
LVTPNGFQNIETEQYIKFTNKSGISWTGITQDVTYVLTSAESEGTSLMVTGNIWYIGTAKYGFFGTSDGRYRPNLNNNTWKGVDISGKSENDAGGVKAYKRADLQINFVNSLGAANEAFAFNNLQQTQRVRGFRPDWSDAQFPHRGC